MQNLPTDYKKLKASLRRGDMAVIARIHGVSRMAVTLVAQGKLENLDIKKSLIEAIKKNQDYLKLKAEVETELQNLLR